MPAGLAVLRVESGAENRTAPPEAKHTRPPVDTL